MQNENIINDELMLGNMRRRPILTCGATICVAMLDKTTKRFKTTGMQAVLRTSVLHRSGVRRQWSLLRY